MALKRNFVKHFTYKQECVTAESCCFFMNMYERCQDVTSPWPSHVTHYRLVVALNLGSGRDRECCPQKLVTYSEEKVPNNFSSN